MRKITKILTLTTTSLALVPLFTISNKTVELKSTKASVLESTLDYGAHQQISDESHIAKDNLVGQLDGKYSFDDNEGKFVATLTIVSDDGSAHDKKFPQTTYDVEMLFTGSSPVHYKIESTNHKAYFDLYLDNTPRFPILYADVQSAWSTKPTNYVIGWYA